MFICSYTYSSDNNMNGKIAFHIFCICGLFLYGSVCYNISLYEGRAISPRKTDNFFSSYSNSYPFFEHGRINNKLPVNLSREGKNFSFPGASAGKEYNFIPCQRV